MNALSRNSQTLKSNLTYFSKKMFKTERNVEMLRFDTNHGSYTYQTKKDAYMHACNINDGR